MAEEHTFDVVSKVEMFELVNAVNMAKKELSQRFDFKGSKSQIDLENEEIVIVADDALSFVSGSKARESEGHANPFAVYSHMGRSLGVGLITVAHNYSLISPTLRHNTDTVISLGSHGDDASALARFMSLTPEQAEMLPRIRPGTGIGISRSTWPYAVMGAVPMIV